MVIPNRTDPIRTRIDPTRIAILSRLRDYDSATYPMRKTMATRAAKGCIG
jgi:hypothetical protein